MLTPPAIPGSRGVTTAWPSVGWGGAQAALARAEASVTKAGQREAAAIGKPRLHLPAQHLETPETAQAALAGLAPSWRYHQVDPSSLIEPPHDACKGRPTPTTPSTTIDGPIPAQVRPDQARLADRKPHTACGVVGTPMDVSQLRALEVMQA